jgi:hypothetical protein
MPRLGNVSYASDARRHREAADRDEGTRAKAADPTADRNQENRADDVEQRHSSGYGSCGPTSGGCYRANVNSGPEQSEGVSYHRRQHAGADDPPAVVYSWRYRDVRVMVKRCFHTRMNLVNSWIGFSGDRFDRSRTILRIGRRGPMCPIRVVARRCTIQFGA